jgi:hypothetical protein
MKYSVITNTNKRIPNEYIYNIFLTLVIAICIILAIKFFVPNNHTSIYFTSKK